MADRRIDEMFPFGVAIGGDVIGTSRTTEVRKLGDRFVLKEIKKASLIERKDSETDEQYRKWRLARSLDIIQEEKRLSDIASNFIPKEVQTFPESYFIADGADGFPTPYKVQEFARGKTIRGLDKSAITEETKKVMDRLVAASVRCFLRTGKVFDIVGCVSGDRDTALDEVIRHLDPLKFSSNVLVDENSRLAFIDARVGGGNLLVQLVSFTTLAGYYWSRILDKLGR